MTASASYGRLALLGDISHAGGFCYAASTPDDAPSGDDLLRPAVSFVRLFEDGLELGPAHSRHDDIRSRGRGQFSHWGRSLFFSSSDESDPRTNGRAYRLLYSLADDPRAAVLGEALNVNHEKLDREQRYAWGERLFAAFVADAKVSEFGRTMFSDAEFLADYERFDRQNYRSFDRKFAMKELLKLALAAEGDVVECGVFRGASAYLLAKAMAAYAPAKQLHLFDSFAGLSPPEPARDGSHWQAGDLACDLAEVAANLERFADRVVFHPGWIPEKFPKVGDKQFCFVHVDVDLYEPTRHVLAFFGKRLVPGGIVVCDDYGFETCQGARIAMEEYADAVKKLVVHLPTGQGVIF